MVFILRWRRKVDKGANLGIVRIKASHCYNCGEMLQANKSDLKETQHHAIPQKLKPKRNFIIPICKGCHQKINDHFMPKTQMKRLVVRLESLKKQADSIAEMAKDEEDE